MKKLFFGVVLSATAGYLVHRIVLDPIGIARWDTFAAVACIVIGGLLIGSAMMPAPKKF